MLLSCMKAAHVGLCCTGALHSLVCMEQHVLWSGSSYSLHHYSTLVVVPVLALASCLHSDHHLLTLTATGGAALLTLPLVDLQALCSCDEKVGITS